MTIVGKLKSSPYVEKFQMSPHDRCGVRVIWNFPHMACVWCRKRRHMCKIYAIFHVGKSWAQKYICGEKMIIMVGAVFCKSENQGTHYFSHRHNSFNQRGFLSFTSIFCETSLLHNIKTYGWAFEQCTISHGAICNICRYKARLGDKIYRKTDFPLKSTTF